VETEFLLENIGEQQRDFLGLEGKAFVTILDINSPLLRIWI
jgi:hypothetical protein